MQQLETIQIPELDAIEKQMKDMQTVLQDLEKQGLGRGYQEPAMNLRLPTQAEAMDLLSEGFGVASASTVAGFVSGFTKNFNFFGISPTGWAAIVGGWLGMGATSGNFKNFFRGVLMAGIGKGFVDMGFTLGKFTGSLGQGGGAAPAATETKNMAADFLSA